MHESFDYYLDCRLRQRNTGLFIADRVSQCFPFVAVWRRESGPLSGNPSLLLTLDVCVDAGIMTGVIGAVGC